MKTVNNAPRGIRNNNPGNLENNGIAWQGLSAAQTDSRFYQFDSAEYGIRALARTLKTYNSKYGLNTVEQIINRWAPPHENNTVSYVDHVAKLLGVLPNEPININDHLVTLTRAIIEHENGLVPYDQETIKSGVMMA